ncbi:MAG: MASE3 domain-containing protein [Rhodoferax sp.]
MSSKGPKKRAERADYRRQAAASGGIGLRLQLMLTVSFAVLALVVSLLPTVDLGLVLGYYFPIHVVLEFLSVMLVVLVFSTVWHTPATEVSASFLLIAVALFASGWLDFAHAMLFRDLATVASPLAADKGAALLLAARLIVVLTLLGVGFVPQLAPAPSRLRVSIFCGFTAVCLLVASLVFFQGASLPVFRLQGSVATGLGNAVEGLIAALFAVTAWRAYRLSQGSDDKVLSLLFGAVAIAGLSEVLVSQRVVVSDLRNLLGHGYKLVSYGLFYQAMFVICVNRPYEKLTAQILLRRKSDQTLRTQALALDSTVAPVILADLEGTIVWRNRASLALLGKRASDLEPGSSLFAAPVTPDPVVAERMRATVQVGGVWQGLVYLKDQRGRSVTLDQTVTPVRDESGTSQGYISVAENVTQREYAQLRYKQVISMSVDGFWMADGEGRLREVNEAYARMSGYTVDELLTMHISQLESKEYPEDVQARMEKITRLGKDQFETRHRHKLGHEFTVDVSVLYDPVPQHFYTFVRDRTELILAAAAKKALERQLQQSQKVEQLGQLTGGIAHDFNNSLATILGYSRLALDRFVPDKQSKLANYLHEVVAASERARDLIAKMLTFAGTRPSISTEVIAASEVVHRVVNMMRVSITSGIQLKTWIEDEMYICIDPSELSQVLVNLIINARDAIGEHGVIDILVHRTEVDGEICAASHSVLSGTFAAIEVSDTGSGIMGEHMSRLFDPFFTTKEVGKGTGLGLSMVQGILRRSGGYVVVKSQPGTGTWFQLLFPIATPSAAKVSDLKLDTAAHPSTGQRIWVLDDEPSVARFLGELLEEWGYHVRLFNHPSRLLAAFDTDKSEVDLVITDQTMPGLTGLELAQRLHGLQPDLPIILCSGYADSVGHSEALRYGIQRYLMKPHNPKELREALAEQFAKKEVNISQGKMDW